MMYSKIKISKRAVMLFAAMIFLLSNIVIFPIDIFRGIFVPIKTMALPETNYRCYLEYTIDNGATADKTAGILRQTIIYVYALKGETICLGSDIYDSHISIKEKYQTNETRADIVVVYPDSSVHPLDTVLNGIGYIGNITQENNPPDYIGDKDHTKYYKPHMLTAPEDGVYEIRFHSYSGQRGNANGGTHRKSGGNDPTAVLKTSNNWMNTSATVGAWDVTVVDTRESDAAKQIKSGRAYTKCLCLNAGQNNINISEEYYVITNDGYIYKTEFEKLDPFGFVFFSNNRGLIDNETSFSAYHSYNTGEADLGHLMDDQNVTFQNPYNKDTDTDKTFRVFFETPDPALEEILYPKAYVPDEITNIEFIGSKCDNISYVADGGYFKFTVSRSTSATVRISFDDYNQNNGTDFKPVSITQNAFAGDNYFYWDGCDGNGTVIPIGVYESGINIRVTNHAGEYHFPLFDVENSNGQLRVERVNEVYKRSVNSEGVAYDENVTEQFADQKYNVYYNNKITLNGTVFERNALITDPNDIKYLQKYCYKFGMMKASEYDSYETKGGIRSYQSYHVRVFNREATIANLELSDVDIQTAEDEGTTHEEYKAYLVDNKMAIETDERAYYDYYLVIADQLDRSEGINSNTEKALNFPKEGEYRKGDLTALDIWTYALGTPVDAVLKSGIIIEDLKGYLHANIEGKVFFDTDESKDFNLHAGDYGIADVEVKADYTYTETRWKEDADGTSLICTAADGKVNKLVPTDTEGEYKRYVNNEFADIVSVTKKEIPHSTGENTSYHYSADIPINLVTRTDSNGNYLFTGILLSEESERFGNLNITVTRPSDFYTLTTGSSESGDFKEINLKGTEVQVVPLSKIYERCPTPVNGENLPAPTFSVADVGYYYEEYTPPIVLNKEWENEIADDPDRPDSITFHIVGTTKDAPNVYRYENDFEIHYYEDSWQETLSHLPKKYLNKELTYKVLYEKFTKNGVTYYFDGERYYSDYDNKITVTPPYYSTMSENKTYTGHYLTVINAEFHNTIEIIKLADNERQNGIDGAEFKVEWYDTEAEEWKTVAENVVTDDHGILKLDDRDLQILPGKYRFTETKAPDDFVSIDPFEIQIDGNTAIYRQTIYEPPEKAKLTLTKTFSGENDIVVSFPDQELTFTVELSNDSSFSSLIGEKITKTIVPDAGEDTYVVCDVDFPNLLENEDVYVRVTEQNAGSYNTTASISALSGRLGTYVYPKSEYNFDDDNAQEKVLTFRLKPPEENGMYTGYDIELNNDATKLTEKTLQFKKEWIGPDNSKISAPSGISAVYAMLMRKTENEEEAEQVITALAGSSNGSNSSNGGKYVSIGTGGGVSGKKDSEYTAQGYFSLNWTKNFSDTTYWILPAYAPDGSKYIYSVKEVTNERGNPLCAVTSSNAPQFVYDYKVIPSDEYTETFTADSNNLIKQVDVKVQNGSSFNVKSFTKSLYTTSQSNYFILNRFAPDLTLKITKNQLSDTNDPNEEKIPLKEAEFTLYSDADCSEKIGKITTSEDGVGVFEAPIEYGKTYYLKETKAPTGYAIDEKIIKLEYNGKKTITLTEIAPDGTQGEPQTNAANNEYVVNITRTNVLNITIPGTGNGITAKTYAMIGLSVMGMAVIAVFILCKRVNAADSG